MKIIDFVISVKKNQTCIVDKISQQKKWTIFQIKESDAIRHDIIGTRKNNVQIEKLPVQ